MRLSQRMRSFLFNLLAWTPYILYIGYVVSINRGPIDYETFMEIGGRALAGEHIYGVNSFYPMPTVLIFAAFRAMPRTISMTLWLLLPVLGAWLISGRKPWVLLFGPLFGHFAGGQSAGLAMLGLWGWRRNQSPDRLSGGLWLGLLSFKPQLAVFPVLFAGWQWLNYLRKNKRIPRQGLGWVGAVFTWWLAGELALHAWVSQWLANPRPLFERALAGILPRTLVVIGINENTPFLFWGFLCVGAMVILFSVWRFNRRRMPFDHWLLASATFNPLLHDYDLIQLIPLLDTPLRQRWAILASIPLWGVILFAYANNQAWSVVTLIAPILLCVTLVESRMSHSRLPE